MDTVNSSAIKIDKIIRAKRRSIGLRITKDAELIIRAPKWVPVYEIERLVAKKSNWIIKKQELLRSRLKVPKIILTEDEKNAYKSKALIYFNDRVKHYANCCGLVYKSVKVNEAKTRWGSCGGNDSLNFTWRLILAPYRVIDYVVVHELMHIKQKNHSRKFWAEVKNLIPDYKKDEQWLKDNGYLLNV